MQEVQLRPQAQTLKERYQQAKHFLVLLSDNPTYDAVASGLALYLALKESGKRVQIACSSEMRVEFSKLVGVDRIRTSVGNRDLVITFDYEQESVERVSYNISEDNKKFHLTISPKAGGSPLDPSSVQFDYSGAQADVVFFVGVNEMEELGLLYEDLRNMLYTSFTMSLVQYEVQPFAQLNISAENSSCMAEKAVEVLEDMELPLSQDIASNLLAAIDEATNHLQSFELKPETLEAVAKLMRAGGKRLEPPVQASEETKASTANFAELLRSQAGKRNRGKLPPLPGLTDEMLFDGNALPQGEDFAIPPFDEQPPLEAYDEPVQPQQVSQQRIPQLQRATATRPVRPQGQQGRPMPRPVHRQQQVRQPRVNQQDEYVPPENPPEDWMQPKVFTGAGKI